MSLTIVSVTSARVNVGDAERFGVIAASMPPSAINCSIGDRLGCEGTPRRYHSAAQSQRWQKHCRLAHRYPLPCAECFVDREIKPGPQLDPAIVNKLQSSFILTQLFVKVIIVFVGRETAATPEKRDSKPALRSPPRM